MALRLGFLLGALTLAALLPAAPAAAHRDKSPRVVASGLDNPRGLAVDHRGTVYVTEAGTGGSGPCLTGPEGDQVCAGATGAVTKAWHHGQKRILEGLPSVAAPGGDSAIGPSDIHLRHWGGAYLTVGLGADPAARDALGELGPSFGLLHKLSHFGGLRTVADIAAFEATANPDGGLPDSNPHSVTTRWGRTYVVDAGGNSLVRVHRSGEISTVAVFPDRLVDAPPGIPGLPPQLPMQAVPTSVVVGPDGALYVSQLTGFPFVPGAANIYRVEPGSEPEVYASGFTNVTDLAFDRHDNLYVLEFAANGILSGDPTGALIRVHRDGSHEPVAIEGLVNPTGLAVGRKGELYISNHGAEAGAGEVLRLRP
jgi:hypothetical protein